MYSKLFGLIALVLFVPSLAGFVRAEVVVTLRNGGSRVVESVEFKDEQLLLPGGERLERDRVKQVLFVQGRNNWTYRPARPDSEAYRKYLQTGQRLAGTYRQYASYLVEDENVFTVRKEGGYEYQSRTILYIARDDGKAAASVSHPVMSGRERVHFLALRSISSDLEIQDVPADGIRFEQTDARSKFYTRWLTVQAEIPGAAVGGLLEITKRQEVYNPIDPDIWYARNYFQSFVPVARSVLVLRLPTKVPLNSFKSRLPKEAGEPRVQEREGFTEYRWETGEQAPLEAEPQMPPRAEVAPFLGISPLFEHQRLYDLLERLVGDKIVPDDSVQKKALQLTRDAVDDEEKVARIYHFLQRHIRYVSVKGSIGSGWGGHPAWMTLKNRYGDCIDKAILMTAMLDACKIRSEVAIVMTHPGPQIMDKLPVLSANHAITRVSLGDRYFYLDSTASDFRYPTFRSDDHGVQALLYKSRKIEKVPAPDPSLNRINMELDMRLEQDGDLQLTRTITSTGQHEAKWRNRLTGITDKRLREWLLKEAEQLAHGSRLVSFQNDGVDDLATPVRATVTWEVPGYVQRTGGMQYFRIPFTSMKFKQASLPRRSQPLDHPRPTSSVIKARLELPPGRRLLATPEPLSVKSPHYQAEASYSLEGNQLKFVFRFDHFSTRVAPEDYPVYRRGLLETEKYLEQFLFLQVERGKS